MMDSRNHTNNTKVNNRVARSIADKFIGALIDLESARDVEQIVMLFADDCQVGNVLAFEKYRGIEGARRFWTNYRANFGDVCSVFQNEIYSENNVVLEWTTEGKIKNGRKIKYAGVSILETEGEKITRFYAYFDSKHLEQQIIAPKNGNGRHEPKQAPRMTSSII